MPGTDHDRWLEIQLEGWSGTLELRRVPQILNTIFFISPHFEMIKRNDKFLYEGTMFPAHKMFKR